MSYARFGPDSDVYVYASTAGGVECCRYRFIAGLGPWLNDARAVIRDKRRQCARGGTTVAFT